LSTTTRFGDLIVEQFAQLAFGQAAACRLASDPVAKPLELLRVQGAQTVVLPRGEKHCYVPLLATDHNGFALCGVE
jgi:hypothetical protein